MSIIRMAVTYVPVTTRQSKSTANAHQSCTWERQPLNPAIGNDSGLQAILQNGFWTLLQLGFAILCACLPVYRPLLPRGDLIPAFLRRLFPALSRPATVSSARRTRSTSNGRPKSSRADTSCLARVKQSSDSYLRLGNAGNRVSTQVAGNAPGSSRDCENEFPMQAIKVEKTIDIV